MKWGDSLITEDLADSTNLPQVLDSMQDLIRLMELVIHGMEHDDPGPDDAALLYSLLWPLRDAAHQAAKLEGEQRVAPLAPTDPTPPPTGPLHVVREGGA